MALAQPGHAASQNLQVHAVHDFTSVARDALIKFRDSRCARCG